jgi:hypothetical protein
MKTALSRTPLAPIEYYEMLLRNLVPMLAGSELDPSPVLCDDAAPLVLQPMDRELLLRPDSVWKHQLRLRRVQPFEPSDVRIADKFLRALREKLIASDQPFFSYLLDRCPQDVVAWSMQHKLMDDALLPTILTLLQKWASETYEGGRISAAIAVDPAPTAARVSTIHLSDIVKHDYAKVLTNGMDSVLVLSPSGHVVEYLTLSADVNAPDADVQFAPNRYLRLANWAAGHRVAIALNRQGEILVFKGSRLQFAFRRGTWSHFSHDALIARMGGSKRQRPLMRAVYTTCLDVSFARTGGCIAVTKPNRKADAAKYLDKADLLASGNTEKTSLLNHLIGERFPSLPRPQREEIVAIDGAIVLDATGVVLAAGAIVKVRGGSEAGGRRAAAKALSRLGLALKVSADGTITAFTDGGSQQKPEIAFEVCG